MRIIYHPIFLDHDTGEHPENPNRLKLFSELPASKISSGEDYLGLVHEPHYIELVRAVSKRSQSLDADTRTSPKSFETAAYAVGAALQAAENGDFAIVRPPGHHAYPAKGTGFCLFNNIAIAVKMLLEQGNRVLILDIDGHFGDGTSHVFYDTDKVLYWSIHQYPAFPGGGNADQIGTGKGKGFTINVLLPAGSRNDIFYHAFESFLPVADQFQPDVVAISAGFDGHHADSLLQLNLTVNAYFHVSKLLRDRFGHFFAVLEGGYNPDIVTGGVYNFIAGINGQQRPYRENSERSESGVWNEYEKRLKVVNKQLGEYWKL